MHYTIPEWLFHDDNSLVLMEIDEKFSTSTIRSPIRKSTDEISKLPLPNIGLLRKKRNIKKNHDDFDHDTSERVLQDVQDCTGNKIDEFILLPRHQSSPKTIIPRRLDFDI